MPRATSQSHLVNVNGRISDERDAVVSVFDHGFLYGEGVYETMRTYAGRPFLYDRHMRRLRASAEMIALPLPISDDEIRERHRRTMAAAALGGEAAYIRLLVTRAVSATSPTTRRHARPSVVVIVKPHIELPPKYNEACASSSSP